IVNSTVSVSKIVNFPIYCLSSKHFRTNLRQLVCRSSPNGRRMFGLSSFTSTLVSSVRSLSSRRTKYNSVSTASDGQPIKQQRRTAKAQLFFDLELFIRKAANSLKNHRLIKSGSLNSTLARSKFDLNFTTNKAQSSTSVS
uniref:Uncharacterized protein n=1 Tax=Romanomermis culicivorax TaxID=13658 RepID=A0A915L427_ROMCU